MLKGNKTAVRRFYFSVILEKSKKHRSLTVLDSQLQL